MTVGKSSRILFIGNSFTARNSLPELIARMAAARGKRIHHHLISKGGASLRTHWNSGEAHSEIGNGDYDFVVLQEPSTLPIKNAERMKENVRLFDAAIKATRSATVLYMTWSRRHAPETQQAISEAYTSLGQELGATVVPVGTVWQSFLRGSDKPILHDKDGSHPTIAGSYLAACVFVGSLLNENPTGIDVEVRGLDAKDQAKLQAAAWQTIKSKTKRRTR